MKRRFQVTSSVGRTVFTAVSVALAVAAMAIVAAGGPLGANQDRAVGSTSPTKGSYDNGRIAEKAIQYAGGPAGQACSDAGTPGDAQCRMFVNCIVRMVSRDTGVQDLSTKPVGGDYFASFTSQGGRRVEQADLSKGDIVQVRQYEWERGLHTFIIVGRVHGDTFDVVESNVGGTRKVTTGQREVLLSETVRAFRMGSVPLDLGRYAGFIVQWDGDKKPHKTAWLVVRLDSGGLGRRYIETTADFWCLQGRGHRLYPEALSSTILDLLPDQWGVHATCENTRLHVEPTMTHKPIPPKPAPTYSEIPYAQPIPAPSAEPSTASTPPPAPAPEPDPAPAEPAPAEPQRWQEQTGRYGSKTFRDHHAPSGEGLTIAPYGWVTVTCRVYDPRMPSNSGGWWYLVHSSPWNDEYYAPASTFWNGDVEGQKPYTHNWDENVRVC